MYANSQKGFNYGRTSFRHKATPTNRLNAMNHKITWLTGLAVWPPDGYQTNITLSSGFKI